MHQGQENTSGEPSQVAPDNSPQDSHRDSPRNSPRFSPQDTPTDSSQDSFVLVASHQAEDKPEIIHAPPPQDPRTIERLPTLEPHIIHDSYASNPAIVPSVVPSLPIEVLPSSPPTSSEVPPLSSSPVPSPSLPSSSPSSLPSSLPSPSLSPPLSPSQLPPLSPSPLDLAPGEMVDPDGGTVKEDLTSFTDNITNEEGSSVSNENIFSSEHQATDSMKVKADASVKEEVKCDVIRVERDDLFQIMTVVLDKSEETLVQKVLPVESAVAKLCNLRKLGSFGPERIAFEDLSQIPFVVIGVYGRNDLVLQYLEQIGAVEPNAKVEFQFGIYLYLGSDKNYAFLWDTENSFAKITRRNIVCNFFRYLQELSQHMVILLNSDDLAYIKEAEDQKEKEEMYIYSQEIVQQNTKRDMILGPGFTFTAKHTITSLASGFYPGILASTTIPAKSIFQTMVINEKMKSTVDFFREYLEVNEVLLPQNQYPDSVSKTLDDMELVVRFFTPEDPILVEMDKLLCQHQINADQTTDLIQESIPSAIKCHLSSAQFFKEYYPDAEGCISKWNEAKTKLCATCPWLLSLLRDVIFMEARNKMDAIERIAQITSHIMLLHVDDIEKTKKAVDCAFKPPIFSVDEYCNKMCKWSFWWGAAKKLKESGSDINPKLHGLIANALAFCDSPHENAWNKAVNDYFASERDKIRTSKLDEIRNKWKDFKGTFRGNISTVTKADGLLQFHFHYQVLIPEREEISFYRLLPDESKEGSMLVVSTPSLPHSVITKTKAPSQIWHASIIRGYTLFVERFNEGGYINLHSLLNGIDYKKELSRESCVDLIDCDVMGGYIAVLSSHEVHIWQYDTTSTYFKLQYITTFDFLLRDTEFYSAGPIKFMRWLPKQRKIIFINSESEVAIYNLSQNQIPPDSSRKVMQNTIVQLLIDDAGTYCVILHAEEVSMQITAVDISTMSIVKTMDLPKEFTPNNTAGSCLYSIVGKLYLACIYQSTIFSVRVELCYEQLTTTVRSFDEGNYVLNTEAPKKGCALDYFAHAYSKFCVFPSMSSKKGRPMNSEALELNLYPTFFMEEEQFEGDKVADSVENYIENSTSELNNLNKGFHDLKLHYTVSTHLTLQNNINTRTLKQAAMLADFVYKIIWLAPLQIVRAENNQFKPLSDGVEMKVPEIKNATNLAAAIRFGMYDYILNSWGGNVKTVTSMGKQSTGKSTMMNQLFGTFFDVSGARCTDGVWLTVRIFEGILYILLDFEGFGSIERQPQEDIFLAVFNAAVGTVTFLRTENRIDSDFINIFTRFSQGVGLVKDASNFFKGKLAIVVKDVDKRSYKDVVGEITNKTTKVVKENNFFSKMFSAEFKVVLSPLFETIENFKLSEQLAELAKLQATQYNNGTTWKKDVTLLMSKLHIQDWTSLSQQRIEMYHKFISTHIKTALETGCNEEKDLITYTGKQIPDTDLKFDSERNAFISDTVVLLQINNEESCFATLMHHLESIIPRTSENHCSWYNQYTKFILAIIMRRCERVKAWAHPSDLDSEVLSGLETFVQPFINEFTTKRQLCTHNCSECYFQCVLHRDHGDDKHNCLGSHKCDNKCSHCNEIIHNCGEMAGHKGKHNCRVIEHMCNRSCMHSKFTGCNQRCAELVDHEGADHLCNSPNHYCGEPCSALECLDYCEEGPGNPNHKHSCGERLCTYNCCMPECPFKCAESHFHTVDNPNAVHLCEREHLCRKMCEIPGICSIDTLATRQQTTETFVGKRGQFDFLIVRQNPKRLQCAVIIPAGQQSHQGLCMHTLKKDVEHYCQSRCPMCNYICEKGHGHHGCHYTSHGNMVNTVFTSIAEDIDMGQHKYVVSESGMAEMCSLYCSMLGRGHLHVKECDHGCERNPEEIQHEKRPYQIDPNIPKDEIVHSLFWRNINWEDPSSSSDKESFALCSTTCGHLDHVQDPYVPSYCTKRILHPDRDAHAFKCTHQLVHVVAVIDASGSMTETDIVPKLATLKAAKNTNNRLGAVLDSLDRFANARARQQDTISVITFNDEATRVITREQLQTDLITRLSGLNPRGSTNFSKALQLLLQEINEARSLHRKIMVIFLTDGEDGSKETEKMMEQINDTVCWWTYLWLYLIQFSSAPVSRALKRMHEMAGSNPPRSELSHNTDLDSLFNQMLHIAEAMKQKVDLVIKRKV